MEGATSRGKLVGLWILTGFLALAFIANGIMKIAGVEAVVDNLVETLNVPSWAIPLIGVLELAGGIALLIDRTRFFAAAGLVGVMLGAVATHLVNGDFAGFAPALVLGVLAGVLAWTQRPDWVRERTSGGATA